MRSCSLHLSWFRFIIVRLGEHGMLMSNHLLPRRNHSPPSLNLNIPVQNINTLQYRLHFYLLIFFFKNQNQVPNHSFKNLPIGDWLKIFILKRYPNFAKEFLHSSNDRIFPLLKGSANKNFAPNSYLTIKCPGIPIP